MKKLILAGLLSLFVAAPAQAGLLDLAPLADFAAEKIKETKGVTLVDLNGKVSGGLLLPIWTIHTKSGLDLAQFGVGATLKEGGEYKAIATGLLNLPGIAARLLNGEWAKTHIRRTKLPPIWLGPYVQIPFPYERWVIGSEVGVMLGIELGGSPKELE